jgi:TRAP-type C4-dicarboxylate transport system permease small subunit
MLAALLHRVERLAVWLAGWAPHHRRADAVDLLRRVHALRGGQPDGTVTEATALLLFPAAFLGLAYALKEDAYPKVLFLRDALGPRGQRRLDLLNLVLMIVVGGFFAIAGVDATLRAFESGAASEILLWPRYLFWAPGALALVVFTLYVVLRLVALLTEPLPTPRNAEPGAHMEWYHVGTGLLLLLVLFIGIGLSIPFALAAASLPFLFYIQGWSTALVSSELKLWGVWIDYVLLAVPLFVLLGELIGRSTIGPNLYQFMHRGVRVRGSAAYGSIAACAGFGAVCGSSMVGSLTIGGVALPEMKKLGYDKPPVQRRAGRRRHAQRADPAQPDPAVLRHRHRHLDRRTVHRRHRARRGAGPAVLRGGLRVGADAAEPHPRRRHLGAHECARDAGVGGPDPRSGS